MIERVEFDGKGNIITSDEEIKPAKTLETFLIEIDSKIDFSDPNALPEEVQKIARIKCRTATHYVQGGSVEGYPCKNNYYAISFVLA